MSTRVRSFSKINLGLAVGPARADGYHGLVTVYQTLALCDVVTVEARRAGATRVELEVDHAGVPSTARRDAERNTAWKMVVGALERMGIAAEVRIGIEKRLPVQGGMGAGSANAAAALIGLERELGVALAGAERLKLAAEVGSDVPLFLLGGTVLGLGRGEEVYPLPDLPGMACAVAVPGVGVSTAAAFRELDARQVTEGVGVVGAGNGSQLTSLGLPDRLKELSRALAAVWTTDGAELGGTGISCSAGDLAENPLLALVRTGIENDFEEVVFSQHPSLRSTKRELMGSDSGAGNPGRAVYAALSGSGSALFGLYRTQADARAAQQRVQATGVRAILTETLTRTEYWHTMMEEAKLAE
jgi:4-diphosphocytidyl-2-C-methyl-D-erythritol kinase